MAIVFTTEKPYCTIERREEEEEEEEEEEDDDDDDNDDSDGNLDKSRCRIPRGVH